MQLRRRDAMAMFLLAGATPRNALAAMVDDGFPSLPKGVGLDSQADFSFAKVLGVQKPSDLDFDVAMALLERAPHNCRPIDVAKYWRDVGLGKIPDLGSARLQRRVGLGFVRGWPVTYNPVIINFFKETSLDPTKGDGDGTSWCAAFLNWCIARSRSHVSDLSGMPAGKAFGSGSASSGSFRCWGKETQAPQIGDVVVWAVEGTVRGCAVGEGHVGIYAGPAEHGRMEVIGGNQRNPLTVAGAGQSAVCEKTFGRSFTVARKGKPPIAKLLHSFRTAPFLR